MYNKENNMFQSRKQKLNGYIEERIEYDCVLCDHTIKVDEIIKKANQLITGKHKINAIEQKIFNLSLAKVKFDNKLGRPVAELTVKEMRDILDCKGNSIYRHIQNLSHTLRDRTIIINN